MCESEAESVLLRARIAELEAALKPFADFAAALAEEFADEPGGSDVVCSSFADSLEATLTVGDCRRAAAVLGEG